MTKNEFAELFVLQLRGGMAEAFAKRGVSPGDYWPVLSGERTLTLRDIGEIGHITDYDFHVVFMEKPARKDTRDAD